LMSRHLIPRATILGTGLIGGSFALALRKFTTDLHISGGARAEIVQQARSRSAIDDSFTGDLAPALRNADLIFIALPIGVTLDLLPEIARLAPKHALVTDACSTKLRIAQAAAENFSASTALFLGAHPMAGSEVAAIAQPAAAPFPHHPPPLLHRARPRPSHPRSPLRPPAPPRPQPRRPPRAPQFPRTGSRFRRRQRTIQTPPLAVSNAISSPRFLLCDLCAPPSVTSVLIFFLAFPWSAAVLLPLLRRTPSHPRIR